MVDRVYVEHTDEIRPRAWGELEMAFICEHLLDGRPLDLQHIVAMAKRASSMWVATAQPRQTLPCWPALHPAWGRAECECSLDAGCFRLTHLPPPCLISAVSLQYYSPQLRPKEKFRVYSKAQAASVRANGLQPCLESDATLLKLFDGTMARVDLPLAAAFCQVGGLAPPELVSVLVASAYCLRVHQMVVGSRC